MMRYKYFWLSLIILFAAVFIPMPGKMPGASNDKLAHILLFAAISINAVFYFSKDVKLLTKSLSFIATLPVLTEVIQKFIPGRSFETYDIIADYIGLILGVIIFAVLKKQMIAIFKFLGEKYIPNPNEKIDN